MRLRPDGRGNDAENSNGACSLRIPLTLQYCKSAVEHDTDTLSIRLIVSRTPSRNCRKL